MGNMPGPGGKKSPVTTVSLNERDAAKVRELAISMRLSLSSAVAMLVGEALDARAK